MARAIRYCLSVFEKEKVHPVLFVFNTDGFSSRSFAVDVAAAHGSHSSSSLLFYAAGETLASDGRR